VSERRVETDLAEPSRWLQLASSESLWLGSNEVSGGGAYFATFHAGLIGFQVLGPDVQSSDPNQAPVVIPPLAVYAQVDPLLLEVWPAPRKPPLRWPPKHPKQVATPAIIPTLAQWPLFARRPKP
jgi:hypothetical protein